MFARPTKLTYESGNISMKPIERIPINMTNISILQSVTPLGQHASLPSLDLCTVSLLPEQLPES